MFLWTRPNKSGVSSLFPITPHPFSTTMASRFEKNRQLASRGAAHRTRLQETFREATTALDTVAQTLPKDGGDFREEQDDWVASFGSAMVSDRRAVAWKADATIPRMRGVWRPKPLLQSAWIRRWPRPMNTLGCGQSADRLWWKMRRPFKRAPRARPA